MGDASVGVIRLNARQICERLAAVRTGESAAIAFDADGTLWSGDVGEDVYRAAIEAGALRDAARPALEHAAREHGVENHGSASQIAGAIFDAYRADRFPERLVCEVMTWCYAGWTPSELSDFAREALDRAGLDARLNRRLEPILEYARGAGIRAIVISASPAPVVVEAARRWDFAVTDIAAAPPAIENGVILDRMGGTLPYAEAKSEVGHAVLAGARWLAAFGDNVFDMDMFAAAVFGVAVQPKPKLESVLPSLANVVLLA